MKSMKAEPLLEVIYSRLFHIFMNGDQDMFQFFFFYNGLLEILLDNLLVF